GRVDFARHNFKLRHYPAAWSDAGLWPPRRPLADLRLRADARGGDGGIREELAAGGTARGRRADRQGESAAWTAPGGLVGDERWRPAPHRRGQGWKNSARQSVRALLVRL